MPGDIGRYQIDYISIKQIFRNQVKDCKSYPGGDIDSDHNTLIIKCSLKSKTTKQQRQINLMLENSRKETRKLLTKAIRDNSLVQKIQIQT